MTNLDLTNLSDGLLRATIFLPLKDDIGIPEGKYLLIGDEDFPELAGMPIMVGESALAGTEGHTPMSLRLWRIEQEYSVNPAFSAATEALKRSNRIDASGWDSESKPASQEARNPNSRIQVVAEVTTVIRSKDGVLIGDAFEKPIEVVQRVQASIIALTGGVILELLTREQLPGLAHIVISPGPPSPDEGQGTPVMLTTRPFPSSKTLGVTTMLDQTMVEQVLFNTGFLPFVTNMPYFEFHNDAMVQLHRYGNYRQSIIASAAAAESVINGVLELLLWEEGESSSGAAQVMSSRDGILHRSKKEVSKRLGGEWDHTRTGPVNDWYTNILKIRNLIVHVAHDATRVEALAAAAALDKLVTFLADRLASQKVTQHYPKTVILSFGKASLEKRGKWSRRLSDLNQKHHAAWSYEFLQWRLKLVEHLTV